MDALRYKDGVIEAIDQVALPATERWMTITTTSQLAAAIRSLKIRGAPMLGIAAGFGVAQAARRSRSTSSRGVLRAAQNAATVLIATRPTAVNIAWACGEMLAIGTSTVAAGASTEALIEALERHAEKLRDDDARACLAMAEAGQKFIGQGATVMTHCNTGFLCTGGYGTALGVLRLAHEHGKAIHVLAGETRPLLQGARLTVWELGRLGISNQLIIDSAGPSILARGEADAVVVGADRIAANGDTANKIGTYSLALAAREAGVPFVVVAPVSTLDFSIASGTAIEIEQRAEEEVLRVLGKSAIAPPGTRARNPAFDITPAKLITALVTERGIAEPPTEQTIAALIQDGQSPRLKN